MNRKFVYLFIIYFQFVKIQTASVTPTTKITDPYYFGSHYIKIQSTQNNNIYFSLSNNSSYTFNKSLSKTYANITSVTPILASFQSFADGYFGYDVTASAISNPTTQVQITFNIIQNSVFKMLGFNIFIIARPFDIILYPMIFINTNLESVWNPLPWPVTPNPTLFRCYNFIMSFNADSSAGASPYDYYLINTLFQDSPNYLQTYYSKGYPTLVFQVKFAFLFINKDQKNNNNQFSLLTWDIIYEYADSVLSITSTSKYGTDIKNKCIIGFNEILYMNKIYPYFKYNLDSNGINSFSHNSYNGGFKTQTLCFQDLECPTTHPYKQKNSSSCYDCTSNLTIPNCTLYQSVKKYSYTHYQIFDECYSICLQCQQHYYMQDNICKLCNLKFQYCLTCNQSISCLTCMQGFYMPTPGSISGCQACPNGQYYNDSLGICDYCSTTLSNCLNCTNSTECLNCAGYLYYLNSTTKLCLLCSFSMQNCLACTDQNTCISCSFNISYLNSTTNKCDLCNFSLPFCLTCSNQFLCDSCVENLSYFSPANNRCFPCNMSLDFCLTCQSDSVCIGCMENVSYLNTSSNRCNLCNASMDFCQLCLDINTCISCQNINIVFLNAITSTCDFCNTSSFLTNLCQNCSNNFTCLGCTQNISYLNASSNLCEFCNVSLTSLCLLCSDQNTCLLCQVDISYLNTSSGQCNFCNYSLTSLCINCSNQNTCTVCQSIISYLNITNNHCYLCNNSLFQCQECLDQYNCTKCSSLKVYLNSSQKTCHLCREKLQYCDTCSDQSTCLSCLYNYSTLQQKCIFMGCIFSYFGVTENDYICTFCDKMNNFVLQNGKCVCSMGYQLNYTTQTCEQICGDGFTYELQCDDGNLDQTDGCNNKCEIMANYKCNVNLIQVLCKYQILLQLQITSTLKLPNNSAILTITTINNIFPFPFEQNNFISSISSQILANINVIISQNPLEIQRLPSQVLSSSGKQIKVLLMYFFNVQGRQASITFNTSKTKYICQNDQVTLKFTLRGNNGVLKIMKNTELYQGISYGTLFNTIITNILLLTGLLSQKYIGLQCILTLQLIYFSQFLIQSSYNWPVGFQSLFYLKYSNGFNIDFQFSQTVPKQSIEHKFSYLNINKLVIENYNISFVFLFIVFLLFMIVILIFRKKVNVNIDQNMENNNINKETQQTKQLKQKQLQQQNSFFKHQTKQKIINIVYNSISQISVWSILQSLSAFASLLQISNKTLKIEIPSNLIYNCQIFIISTAFFIIIFIGLNNFYNIYLNDYQLRDLKKNYQQIIYKNLNFIYLFIMGIIIFFLNEQSFYGIQMSIVVMVIHLVYIILINFKINPYKNSLKIHQIVLFLQHLIYLIFLTLINLINYIPQLDNIILIAFGYVTTATNTLSILFTIIRLYYQYRYGQALQFQLKKQAQALQIKKIKQEQQKLLKKVNNLQKNAKAKIQKSQFQRLNNNFLQQNINRQNQKQALMDWLEKRNHLSRQEKQQYYYEKFQQRPLNWIKKNDLQKYNKIIQQRKVHVNNKKTKSITKNQRNPNNNFQFQKLKSEMKKQFKQKKQQEKLQKQKKNKNKK